MTFCWPKKRSSDPERVDSKSEYLVISLYCYFACHCVALLGVSHVILQLSFNTSKSLSNSDKFLPLSGLVLRVLNTKPSWRNEQSLV